MAAIQMLYLPAMESLRALRDEEAGQGMVEYSLILVFISIAAIAVLGGIGGAILGVFTEVATALGVEP